MKTILAWVVSVIIALGVAVWVLRPWMAHIKSLSAASTLDQSEPKDSTEHQAIKAITEAVATGLNHSVRSATLSEYALRQWTPQTVDEQLQLVANYSSPDQDIFVPTPSGETISDAYGILLRELIVEASVAADATDEVRLTLDRFLQHRRQSVVPSRTKPEKREYAQTVAQLVRSRLDNKSRIIQLIAALENYEIDEEHTDLIRVVPNPTVRDNLESRTIVNGTYNLTGYKQGTETSAAFSGSVFGPSYQFLGISRPSWFDIEILQYGLSQRTSSRRLDEFFGNSGYLSRIPIGLIILRPEQVQLVTRDYAELVKLANDSDSLYLRGNGLNIALPCGHASASENGVILFDAEIGNPEIVAVVYETL